MKLKIYFTVLLSLFLASHGLAQIDPLNVSVSNIRTVAEEYALQFLVDYSENMTDVFIVPKEKNWYLDLSPSLHFMTGTEDAFSSIEVKVSGNFVNFDTVSVAGIHGVPNSAGFFHVFPISLGVEANKQFTNVNGLVEVGYIPWYQNIADLPQIIRNSHVSILVQGGYKFDKADMDSSLIGTGNEIQGKEINDDAILRIKTSIEFNVNNNHQKTESNAMFLPIGFTGKSKAWFDLVNSEIYYNLSGSMHLYIQPDKSVDFFYEKGSGAPNFHQGNQFGVGLTMRY